MSPELSPLYDGSYMKENIYFLDRPEHRNALDLKTSEEILELGKKLAKQKAPGMIIASRSSKIFCSGGDLKAYSKLTRSQGLKLNQKIRSNLQKLSHLPLIVVAAVDGLALGGGCELALQCDLIATTPQAQFAFKQSALGLTPGWGGLERLLKRTSQAKALEWLASHRHISASEANRTGLSDFIFPRASLLKDSQSLIESLRSRVPLQTLKSLIYSHSPRLETKVFESLWMGPTHKEQLRRFFE